MAVDGPTYDTAEVGGPLRQGEVLSSIVQYVVRASGLDPGQPVNVIKKLHPYAVVLTQECDLAQDFTGRQSEIQTRLLIPNVMMCEVDLADNLRSDTDRIVSGSEMWKRIRQNQMERFQFLRAIMPEFDALGEGVAALLVDFKRTFTVPTDALYEQFQGTAKRRAVLLSPYKEHLSSRHAHFISRIALPIDHHS